MSKSRDIADSAATINYIDTVTSNVQDQIDNIDPLPSQTGNSGYFLTTDGTNPSWADLPASGGVITATASGSITAGDALIMNSDGTVSVASSTDVSASLQESAFLPMSRSYFNATSYYAQSTGSNCVAYDSDSNQYFFMVTMYDSSPMVWYDKINKISFDEFQRISLEVTDTLRTASESYYVAQNAMALNTKTGLGVMAGIYSSTSTATFIPVRFNKNALSRSRTSSKNLYGSCNVVYNVWADETDNKFIIYHRNNSGYPTIATAYTNSDAEYDTELFSGGQYIVSSTSLGAQDPRYANAYFHKQSGKFILVYQSSNTLYVKVATRSGNVFTLGAAQTVFTSTVDGTRPVIDYSETEDVFIFSAEDVSTSNLKVVAGSLSGTTFTFGSIVQTNLAATSNNSGGAIALDPYSRIIIMSATQFTCTSISGTTITSPSSYHDIGDSGWGNQISNIRSSNVFYNQDSGYAFTIGEYGDVYAAKVITSNINANNFVGIADSSVSNGQTVSITVKSGTNTNLSGLTTGKTYYVNAHGDLTTNNTGIRAGIAKSSTELVMV